MSTGSGKKKMAGGLMSNAGRKKGNNEERRNKDKGEGSKKGYETTLLNSDYRSMKGQLLLKERISAGTSDYRSHDDQVSSLKREKSSTSKKYIVSRNSPQLKNMESQKVLVSSDGFKSTSARPKSTKKDCINLKGTIKTAINPKSVSHSSGFGLKKDQPVNIKLQLTKDWLTFEKTKNKSVTPSITDDAERPSSSQHSNHYEVNGPKGQKRVSKTPKNLNQSKKKYKSEIDKEKKKRLQAIKEREELLSDKKKLDEYLLRPKLASKKKQSVKSGSESNKKQVILYCNQVPLKPPKSISQTATHAQSNISLRKSDRPHILQSKKSAKNISKKQGEQKTIESPYKVELKKSSSEMIGFDPIKLRSLIARADMQNKQSRDSEKQGDKNSNMKLYQSPSTSNSQDAFHQNIAAYSNYHTSGNKNIDVDDVVLNSGGEKIKAMYSAGVQSRIIKKREEEKYKAARKIQIAIRRWIQRRKTCREVDESSRFLTGQNRVDNIRSSEKAQHDIQFTRDIEMKNSNVFSAADRSTKSRRGQFPKCLDFEVKKNILLPGIELMGNNTMSSREISRKNSLGLDNSEVPKKDTHADSTSKQYPASWSKFAKEDYNNWKRVARMLNSIESKLEGKDNPEIQSLIKQIEVFAEKSKKTIKDAFITNESGISAHLSETTSVKADKNTKPNVLFERKIAVKGPRIPKFTETLELDLGTSDFLLADGLNSNPETPQDTRRILSSKKGSKDAIEVWVEPSHIFSQNNLLSASDRKSLIKSQIGLLEAKDTKHPRLADAIGKTSSLKGSILSKSSPDMSPSADLKVVLPKKVIEMPNETLENNAAWVNVDLNASQNHSDNKHNFSSVDADSNEKSEDDKNINFKNQDEQAVYTTRVTNMLLDNAKDFKSAYESDTDELGLVRTPSEPRITNEEKSNHIADNLLELLLEECLYELEHIWNREFISSPRPNEHKVVDASPTSRKSLEYFLMLPRGINCGLQGINEYLCQLIDHLICGYSSRLMLRLNKATVVDSSEMLRMLRRLDTEYQYVITENEVKPLILDERMFYAMRDQGQNTNTALTQVEGVSQMPQLMRLELQQCFHRAIFDCFNEILTQQWTRTISIDFLKMIMCGKIPSQRTISSQGEFESLLLFIADKVLDNSTLYCGFIPPKEDHIEEQFRQYDPSVVGAMREDKLNRMLAIEVDEKEHQFIEFNKEQLMTIVDCSDKIFEDLIEGIVIDLFTLNNSRPAD